MATIGSTRPSGQPLRGPSPSLDPNAFGAGVGRALQNLGAQVDAYGASQEALNAAYKERQDKKDRFNELVRLNEWEGQLKRDLSDLQRNAPPGAPNFTNEAAALVKLRRDEFLSATPEAHKDEFAYRTSVFQENAVNTAFDTEYTLANQHFKTTLTEEMVAEQGVVYEDPAAFEASTQKVLAMIDASDLPANEKEELAVRTQQLLAAAVAKREFTDAAIPGRGTVGPADGKDVVAAGLPAIARGVLNGIASVESPGYNVMYGGETFSDYSDHPRVAHVITSGPNKGKTSTAAGRYQFLASTWDRVAAAIGAPDFSPEWQDRAAWYLASEEYKKAQGGGDLYRALMSGDREAVKAVKRVLSPVWEGLQNMSDDAFANYVLGGRGARQGPTPEYAEGPRLFDDPRFAGIPFEEKLALLNDGERQADAARAAQIKAEKEAQDAYVNQFKLDVINGDRGIADIRAAQADGFITNAADYEKLINLWEGRNKDIAALAEVTSILGSGGAKIIHPGNADHMKGLNQVVKLDNGLDRIEQRDGEYITQAIVPLVNTAQVIPSDVVDTLQGMVRSNDPQRVAFGYETLAQLERASPTAFRQQMDEGAFRDYANWQAMRDYYPAEEVIGRIKNLREFRQERQLASQQADKELKEIDMGSVYGEFDTSYLPFTSPDQPLVPQQNLVFEREFQSLFRESYAVTGDADLAKAAAIARMKQRWGPTTVGGSTRLMKYPLQLTGYREVGGSMDWAEAQVREETGIDGDFQLVADTQTTVELEKLRRGQRERLPSYLVFKKSESGEWGAVMDGFEPRRWYGDPTPYINQEIDSVAERTLRQRQRQMQEEAPFIPEDEMQAFEKRYNDLVEQIRGLDKPAPTKNSQGREVRDPTGRVIQ